MNKTVRIALISIVLACAWGLIGFTVVKQISSKHTGTAQSDSAVKSQTASSIKAVNACELVTADEASATVGVAVAVDTTDKEYDGTPQVSFYISPSHCLYVSADNETQVDIRATTPGSGDDSNYASKEYRQTKQGAVSGNFAQTVTGFGDDAYWDTGAEMLYVLKGNSYYSFAVRGGDYAHHEDLSKSLAYTALSRL